MKKSVCSSVIVAMSVLMILCLAGCGSSGTTQAIPSTAPSAEATATTSVSTSAATTAEISPTPSAADSLGKYTPGITVNTVRFLDSGEVFDTSNPDRKSLTENIWAKAYQDQLGITFNYLWTPNLDQYDTKWNSAIASNDIPDMAVVDGTIYKELLQGGLIEDCSEAYNQYATDLYKSCSSEGTGDNGVALNFLASGGKLYGLPLPGRQADDTPLLFIRKDWLAKVNMTEPKTIDDLIKVAKAFKDAKLGGDNTFGLCINKSIISGQSDLLGFLNGCGAYYNVWQKDSADNLVYSTIQPEMRVALQKLQGMYKDGLLKQDFSVLDASQAGQDIASGKVGMSYGVYWAPLGSIGSSLVGDASADWEVLPIPTLDGSAPKPQGTATPGNFIFVKKGYVHPEAAVKVMNLNLKLITEDNTNYGDAPDGFQLFKYRFACESFIPWKNLNEYLTIKDVLKSGDSSKLTGEVKQTFSKVEAGLKGDRTASGLQFTLVFGQNSTYQYINDYKNSNSIITDAFESLPTDTMTTMGTTLQTNLDSVILKVIMGADINTFDNAVTAWKSGGGDQITQEVNAWYAQTKKK
jgi:putative aldouronate transport system substrate-binding protein